MMYFSFFLMVSLLMYSMFLFRKERKERVGRRLSTFYKKEEGNDAEQNDRDGKSQPFIWRKIKPVWRGIKRSFKKKMPGTKEAKLDIFLLQAGSPFGMTSIEYRLLQIALFILSPLVTLGYSFLLGTGAGGNVLFFLFGIAIALLLPNFYMRQRRKGRFHRALRELPDILDLLTVSLEAGLGFDAALSKVVAKKEGVLATEFHRSLEEIRLGKTRREALIGIRDRLGVDEIRSLISSILQAEKLGIGLVQVLKVQSEEVRDQRKQRAEQEAMKAPIKMLFPLVLFIFPSLFIVLLGPAILQFIETFNK